MVWESMEADPEFHPTHNITLSFDEQKKRAARQLARLNHLKFIPPEVLKSSYSTKVRIYLLKSLQKAYHEIKINKIDGNLLY